MFDLFSEKCCQSNKKVRSEWQKKKLKSHTFSCVSSFLSFTLGLSDNNPNCEFTSSFNSSCLERKPKFSSTTISMSLSKSSFLARKRSFSSRSVRLFSRYFKLSQRMLVFSSRSSWFSVRIYQ